MAFGGFFDYPGEAPAGAADELVLLPELAPESWRRLLAQAGVRRFHAGETLIRAGDKDPSVYIVASGKLEVLAAGTRGHRLAVIDAGSVFGEQAFFDGHLRSATVRALTAGEVRSLSREAFDVLAAREPELARAFVLDLARILSLRLRRMSDIIARITA